MANKPLVSVVILSYERPNLFRQALDSVIGQTYSNLEVIVVDNKSSKSEQISKLASSYPNVRCIFLEQNLGYSSGMNRGIQASSGQYVLLTEDDLVLDPDCIHHFVHYMERDGSAALVSGILYDAEKQKILSAGGSIEFGATYKKEIFTDRKAGEGTDPRRVNFITGALIFAKRESFLLLGGFREDYFLYFEDDELCARVHRQGRSIVVLPPCKAFHLGPLSSGDRPEIEFHKVKNFLSNYFLYAPITVLPSAILRYGIFHLYKTSQKYRNPGLFFRVWWWLLKKSPKLVRERLKGPRRVS